jgi:hypothetical protein
MPALEVEVANLEADGWYSIVLPELPQGMVPDRSLGMNAAGQVSVRFRVGSAPHLAEFTVARKPGGEYLGYAYFTEPVLASALNVGRGLELRQDGRPQCVPYEEAFPSRVIQFRCPPAVAKQPWRVRVTPSGFGVGVRSISRSGVSKNAGFAAVIEESDFVSGVVDLSLDQ